MLSSSCFMPTSLLPQSLPPFSPSISSYFGDRTVVTCMRAGLYHTKNGLLVFFGSLRSRKSMTLDEISSSTVFDRSSVRRPNPAQHSRLRYFTDFSPVLTAAVKMAQEWWTQIYRTLSLDHSPDKAGNYA